MHDRASDLHLCCLLMQNKQVFSLPGVTNGLRNSVGRTIHYNRSLMTIISVSV